MNRLYLFLLILLFSCQAQIPTQAGWQKVFQNDAEGNAVFGNKAQLMDAVRLGYPIRIGWGSNRIEHVADADFLTIFEGEEVFAQIRSIIGQAPRIDGDSLKVRFRSQNHWTKIAGTNGYSTGMMTDYFKDSLVGGGIDRYTATTWYVLYPAHKKDIEARPLWRKESPNWEKWEKTAN
ncbi:MAG: hypothetical protein R8P61_24700 [Bacteroidia bacterium]|nr:hypothetical protein [Bacteroidia bacterium]